MLTRTAFIRLCRARDLLRDTDARCPSIREAARGAGMSPFHFIRVFHGVFGETPHQCRMRAQLERAKYLLAVSNYSVTDVCMEIGFSSLGSFSDLFARRVGASPTAYRRSMRKMVQVPGTLPRELTPGCLTLMGDAFAILEKQRTPHS